MNAIDKMITLPLEGITVVSVEQAIAAPLATRQLADLGARVIKIERPGRGDFSRDYDGSVRGLSSHFVWTNRSKQSVALNLRSGDGLKILDRLIESSDVFVHNLAPSTASELGLSAAEVGSKHEKLVACEISGYGDSGPYSDRKAYDLLVQAEAGVLAVTGKGDEPAKVGVPIADIAAGTYAFSGILAALFARERTGRGAVIAISMFESLLEWMGYPLLYTDYGGTAPKRFGVEHATIAPYGKYKTRDGVSIFLAVQNASEWENFCKKVLDKPELIVDERFASNELRSAHRNQLDEIIDEHIAKLGLEDIVAKLEDAGIAYSELRTIEGVLDHPQLEARSRWSSVESPVGTLQVLLPPINIQGSNPVMGAIPSVGEHTELVLREFGFSSEEIVQLRSRESIG